MPVEDGCETGTVVPGLLTVCEGATLEGFALEEPGAGAAVDAPGGGVVGTVAGWLAVFQDAVVGTVANGGDGELFARLCGGCHGADVAWLSAALGVEDGGGGLEDMAMLGGLLEERSFGFGEGG